MAETVTATKTLRTIQSSTSVAAAGNQTSSTWTATTALGGLLVIRMTPGGTLTTGCTAQVNVSGDGTNWYGYAGPTSGLTSGTNYDITYDLGPDVMYAQVVFSGHAGAACTVYAHVEEVTSLVSSP